MFVDLHLFYPSSNINIHTINMLHVESRQPDYFQIEEKQMIQYNALWYPDFTEEVFDWQSFTPRGRT